jgi:ubiquinone/menaquinone biosynthesis C-methylase UbiE
MKNKTWQQTSKVFHERAREYDSWYDDSLLFDIELAALRELTTNLLTPKIEIGVGPGRFAKELGFSIGIDPACAALQNAAQRNIMGIAGVGEHLPLQTGSTGTICMLFTLCFLTDPLGVFKECARVLQPNGSLLVGCIPASSAWGKILQEKKKKNHPFYKYADFKTIAETTRLLAQAGFTIQDSRSTLLQPPKDLERFEKPQSGMNERAGFCVLSVGNN